MKLRKTKTPKGRLILRLKERSRMWYLRKRVNYQEEIFPLGWDIENARKLADKISEYLIFHTVEQTRLHFYPKDEMVGKQVPSIKQVIEYFEEAAKTKGLSPVTVSVYKQAVKQLAAYTIKYPSPDKKEFQWQWEQALETQPITALNPSFLNRVRELWLEERGGTVSAKRSFNSMLRNSQAIFCADTTDLYPEWNQNWVKPFLRVKPFRRVQKRYVLPPDELIMNTFTQLAEIDGPAWVCITLALRAGLRKSEILHARQGWLKPEGMMTKIYIYPEDDFTPKGKVGATEIASSFVKDILNVAGECDYLLGVEKFSHRQKAVTLAATLLRQWGWQDYQRPLHEMRKLFGAMISTTQGLYTAQSYLRHASPQITSDSYSDLIDLDKIVELWTA